MGAVGTDEAPPSTMYQAREWRLCPGSLLPPAAAAPAAAAAAALSSTSPAPDAGTSGQEGSKGGQPSAAVASRSMKLSPGKATVAAWLKDAPHGCVALCGETDAFRAIARHAVLHFATVPQDLGTASSSSSCTKTSTTAGQEDAAAASSASPTNNPDAGAPIVDNNNNNKTAAAAAAAAAVELGASYGCCTKILANRGFETIGVDVSEEALAEAQKIAPTAKLVKADILQNREELLPALQDLLPEVRRATGRPLMLLVDLGGNRPGTLRPVLEAILWFADYLGPDLTVVKSRDLWQDATKYLLKHDKSSLEAWPAAYLAATANDEVRSDKKKKWTGRERPLNGDSLCRKFNDVGETCPSPCRFGWHHFCERCWASGVRDQSLMSHPPNECSLPASAAADR
mmetsp:Transcript_44059/g.94422  ORF Transcript_44059/g.94422 Transcript_44059/m.94422 type:complete len:400 (-) Transcript_44059:4-1203(-)